MNDGVITERGRHDELIDREGLYARIYRTQAIGIA
jgi:ABC-type multidrug transport system fused ATPase/permease subunit